MQLSRITRRPRACPDSASRRLRALVLVVSIPLLGGCAAGRWPSFADKAGVPVKVTTADGETFSGSLIALERGGFLIDRSLPRSERLAVVRVGETDVASVSGEEVGEVVEVRDFDVVVRQGFVASDLAKVEVTAGAYYGWGTAVAAVFSFFATRLVAEAL